MRGGELMTIPLAARLAQWAHDLQPGPADRELAAAALRDTIAVALAARDHPVTRLAAGLADGPRWAVGAHVLDFDDLHMPSTTHISAVCVPAALAAGGGERAYLAAAGVMARLGTILGWPHYRAGWHITCTAGAPAAAAGAAVALGLPPEAIATAIALAVPGAGGVQRAFGTDAKSLQVGFAVDTGIRAARLAAAGAQADPAALDQWLALVGGAAVPAGGETADGVSADGVSAGHRAADGSVRGSGAAGDPTAAGDPAVPGGLAVKIYPCCYALQRPISTLAELAADAGLDPADVRQIVLRTPEATVAPLIHHRPDTGLRGKFSLEYGAAAALLDRYPGFDSFTDAAVRRPAARRLAAMVETSLQPGGSWLLDGTLTAEVRTAGGAVLRASQQYPPGSPGRPASSGQLRAKLADCTAGLATHPDDWNWDSAAGLLRAMLGEAESAAPHSPAREGRE